MFADFLKTNARMSTLAITLLLHAITSRLEATATTRLVYFTTLSLPKTPKRRKTKFVSTGCSKNALLLR
jgi:hypothetical protein